MFFPFLSFRFSVFFCSLLSSALLVLSFPLLGARSPAALASEASAVVPPWGRSECPPRLTLRTRSPLGAARRVRAPCRCGAWTLSQAGAGTAAARESAEKRQGRRLGPHGRAPPWLWPRPGTRSSHIEATGPHTLGFRAPQTMVHEPQRHRGSQPTEGRALRKHSARRQTQTPRSTNVTHIAPNYTHTPVTEGHMVIRTYMWS